MSLLFHSCFKWLQKSLAMAMHCTEIFVDSLILVLERPIKLHSLMFFRLRVAICLGLQKLSKSLRSVTESSVSSYFKAEG